jgi:hypothetical protein
MALKPIFLTVWGECMAEQVPAVKGRPYSVSVINSQHVAVSRNGYTITFTRQDLANVFEALYKLIESTPR